MDIAKMLENRGFLVPDIVSTGIDAISKVEEHNPDLILVDVILSGDMDGISFVEELQKKRDIPVIYITAYSDDKTLARAIKTNPYGYIIKPINNKELYSVIEIALHKNKENEKRLSTGLSFKDVFDNAGSGVILLEPGGTLVLNNKKIAHMLDYKPSDFEKLLSSYINDLNYQPLSQFIHPDEQIAYSEKIEKLIKESNDELRMKTRYLRGNGETMWVELIVTAIKDTNGILQYLFFTVIDITEEKESEKSIMHFFRFEEKISKISSYYVLIGDFDEATTLTLNEMGTFSNADRTYIVLLNSDLNSVGKIYPWKSESTISLEMDQEKHYLDMHNCWSDKLLGGETIHIDNVSTFTDGESTGNKILRERRISSLLIMPLFIDAVYVGFIGFDNIMKSGTWRVENIALLRVFSDIIGNALKRKRMEDKIITSLDEKEILLKEIHHRVKNNMQIISSLLALQSHHLHDEKDKELFINTQNRVRSMALVHEMLYQSADIAQIDFSKYINEISNLLFSTYNVDKTKVILKADVKGVIISLDRAIPCALIINELVSNSLKYAFSRDEEGEICIHFSTKKESHKLTISDNGKGFPDDYDIKTSKSLGLQIVTALTSQLMGTYKMEANNGSKFIITFPVD